jgi:hypothetical protein
MILLLDSAFAVGVSRPSKFLGLSRRARFQPAKEIIFWNVRPGQMVVPAWNSHQHSTENSRTNAAA